ncbi:hypothetical protein EMIHUDRAFT_373649, partial [Emiliania huxleyi CCMP1516]|uniref:Uncharacterized protein n=2 Tax=Emiliania huxleyi TaxID=2903 RepID=A0A0D3JYM5_EMIH1
MEIKKIPACCGGAAGRGRARPGPRRLAADERARAARQDGGGGDCGDGRSVVQRSGVCLLSSVVAFRTRARRATRVAPRGHEPSAIRSRSQKLLARTPRPTLPSRPQLLSSPEDWCLICCLPADAAGEPGGPLYYKEVLTRFYLEFFYPHDSERECIRGILWVPHFEGAMKYSDGGAGGGDGGDGGDGGPVATSLASPQAPPPRRTHRRGLSPATGPAPASA